MTGKIAAAGTPRARMLLAVLALLALAACGDPPRPFAHAPGAGSPPPPPADGAGIVVPAPDGDDGDGAALARAVIDALARREVLATPPPGNAASLHLVSRRVSPDEGGAARRLAWRLEAPGGEALGAFEIDWPGGGDAAARERLGSAVADRVVALLAGGAPTPEDRRPPLLVGAIEGAPGDGGGALRRAMKRALTRLGAPLAEDLDRAALILLGSVSVGEAAGGARRVEILWEVITPQGKRLGVVRQENQVPAGRFDRPWGGLARAVADAAAGGILDLLARTAYR